MTNSIRKHIPVGFARQRGNAAESFKPRKAEKYSMVLIEEGISAAALPELFFVSP